MEVGGAGSGLFVGGWGEVFGRAEHHEMNYRGNSNVGTPQAADENIVDTSADALLKVAYRVEDFSLRTDILFTDAQTVGNSVLLEQAYIDWRASSWATVRAGRFLSTWIGWEGYHTDELWRVNNSAVWSWNIQDHGKLKQKPFLTDGVDFKLADPNAPLTLDLVIADDVLGDGPSTTGTDKSYGVSLGWSPAGFGRVELSGVLDSHSMNNGDGTSSTGAAVDLNADITAFLDKGWYFAVETQWHDHGDLAPGGQRFGDAVMMLAMANYAFTEDISMTVMVDALDRGVSLDNNEVIEYAVAVLTKPQRQVRFNCEVFYWNETADQADAYGAAAVLNIFLP